MFGRWVERINTRTSRRGQAGPKTRPSRARTTEQTIVGYELVTTDRGQMVQPRLSDGPVIELGGTYYRRDARRPLPIGRTTGGRKLP